MDENKNLEELEQEVKEELDEVEKGIDEVVDEDVKEVAKKVLEQAKTSLAGLKDAISNLDLNKDGVTLGQHLGKFSQQISDAIDNAQEKVGFKDLDEKSSQAWGATKETLNKVSDNVVKAAKEAYETVTNKEKLKETWDNATGKLSEVTKEATKKGEEFYADVAEKNPAIKETVDKVAEKTKEASRYVSDKYQEFIHDEKVRETVRNAKNIVVDVAGKITDAFNDLFKEEPEAKEEENAEEE